MGRTLSRTQIELSAKDKTRKAFAKVSSSLETLKQQTTRVAVGLSVLTAGMIAYGVKTAASIDVTAKMSKRLGLNVTLLQKYGHVASLAGVSQQNLNTGMQRFQRRAAEAAQGVGESVKAFDELNIQLIGTDGHLRDTETLFLETADALANVASDADKTRLAFKLFDTEGVGFLQFMKDGSASMRKLAKEAEALGIVLNSKQTLAVENMNDAWTRITATLDGVAKQMTASLAPAVELILEDILGLFEVMKGDKSIQEWAQEASMSIVSFGYDVKDSMLVAKSYFMKLDVFLETWLGEYSGYGVIGLLLFGKKILTMTAYLAGLGIIKAFQLTFGKVAAIRTAGVGAATAAMTGGISWSAWVLKATKAVSGVGAALYSSDAGSAGEDSPWSPSNPHGYGGPVSANGNGSIQQNESKTSRQMALDSYHMWQNGKKTKEEHLAYINALPKTRSSGPTPTFTLPSTSLNITPSEQLDPYAQIDKDTENARLLNRMQEGNTLDSMIPAMSPVPGQEGSTSDGVDKTNALLTRLQEGNEFDAGIETTSNMGLVTNALFGGMNEAAEAIKDPLQTVKDLGTSTFNTLADGITNMIMTGKGGFKELGQVILREVIGALVKMGVQMGLIWVMEKLGIASTAAIQKGALVAQTAASSVAAGATAAAWAPAAALSSLASFGMNAGPAMAGIASTLGLSTAAAQMKGFANGGVPPIGRASIVGERGPELFTPRQSGYITPNNKLGGSTVNTYNMNISGNVDDRAIDQIKSVIAASGDMIYGLSMAQTTEMQSL